MNNKPLQMWRRTALGALAASLLWATGASAQDFPNRPIRLVVPQPPGCANPRWWKTARARALWWAPNLSPKPRPTATPC